MFQRPLCLMAVVAAVAAAGLATPAMGLTITPEHHGTSDNPLSIQPYFSVGLEPDITHSETVPWVSIIGTGDGSHRWFSFVVDAPGRQAWFDIDGGSNGSNTNVGGSFDAFLSLYTIGGGSLISIPSGLPNTLDPGSLSLRDPYGTYTFDAAGTYKIALTTSRGGTYILNISLEGAPIAPPPQDDDPAPQPGPQAVPTPAAGAAGLAGLALLGVRRRRR